MIGDTYHHSISEPLQNDEGHSTEYIDKVAVLCCYECIGPTRVISRVNERELVEPRPSGKAKCPQDEVPGYVKN